MKILIVDDEEYLREDLKDALERVSPGNEYYFAGDYDHAMDEVMRAGSSLDIAFLDIQMPGKNGLTLAEQIKRTDPGVNIVMVTAYSQYALDALRLFVSGYILKPVMDDDLKEVLDNLRTPVRKSRKQLEVRCFGNFEIFQDGKPIQFKRKKEKELLAYLICLKGASATRGEICASVFEEDRDVDKVFSYLKIIVSALKKDLERYGFGDMLIHSSNSYSVDTSMIKCDYYDYLTGTQDSMSDGFRGEFMKQYSWAEDYIYALENY